MMNNIVTVFGSSRPKQGESEYTFAYGIGCSLASAGFTLCNGGYGGTMEATARGVKDCSGKTIGITCEYFGKEANPYIDETICVKSHVDRLMKLIELGDAFVVLKGSTGTLLELATIWEFMNKGVMKEKPIVIAGNFWSPVIHTLKDELLFEGKEKATKFIAEVKTPEECVRILRQALSI